MRTLLLFAAVPLLMTACASPATPPSTPIPGPVSTSPVTITPSVSVPGAIGTPTPSVTDTPQSALREALAALHAETRGAQSAASLAKARQHAEAAVNILVGQWGRWYGDADGDGTVNDPLKGVGILPGERVPGPAPDVSGPIFPHGIALLAYSVAAEPGKQAIASVLGDLMLWQGKPRAGYDSIDAAMKASETGASAIAKLPGPLARSVAYARGILTKVNALENVKTFADAAVMESGAALTSVDKLR